MLVSVVIATYRRDESLRAALKSILNQTYKAVEVIVVDDNADEMWNRKVENIIKEIGEIFSIVYIQNKNNKGSAETRNIGIKEAKGEYITFLDDDDIYLPNKIKNQVEHMLETKSDFSITDLELLNESGKRIETRTREYIKETTKEALFKYHLMYHMTGTDTMMFKKIYLLKIGCFPKINVGDKFYLMQNAIEAGGRFSYLPVCDIKAYIHTDTNGLSSGDSKINGENALYKFKMNYFKKLDSKSVRYIKMRHYAVLSFAEIRRKNYRKFLKNSILAVLYSPIDCIKLIVNR